jgi:hypothetical protein
MDPAPKPRRFRRLFGRLTAATLSAAAASAEAPALAEAPDPPPEGLRHDTAAHWFAVSLERMSPLPRTYLACQWALSPDPEQRATVATALEWTFALIGDSVIIDHLSRDPLPGVRAAAARAAWVRQPLVGEDVLARLAADPAPEVRDVALLASRGR